LICIKKAKMEDIYTIKTDKRSAQYLSDLLNFIGDDNYCASDHEGYIFKLTQKQKEILQNKEQYPWIISIENYELMLIAVNY